MSVIKDLITKLLVIVKFDDHRLGHNSTEKHIIQYCRQ
jgi:hypothetical protein